MSIICADFTKPMTHKPFKVGTYVDFGPPSISNAPIGTLYFDKHTNKIWVLNSEKKWIHMANYGEYNPTAAKGNKNTINCRNCGAPVYRSKCDYCDTCY